MNVTRPPMGWNSWNTFGENPNEELILEMADAMVEKGYKDAGYEYVVIDDCWSLKERDENGRLVPDPERFPHGMKYVADYIHSKGLKFGMYTCAGVMTCAGYPGSYGHEYTDAKTFAEWEVDFLKYDYCFFPKSGNCRNAYLTMSLALRASGRDILFSACNWGCEESWNWMRSVGANMYRSTGDVFDTFTSFRDIILAQEKNFSMSAPGCYNDIDMLVVGMYGKGHVGIKAGCTDNEYAMHFALWSLFGAPLMMGGDIRSINEFSKNLMQNRELIAINQDEECRPPVILNADAGWEADGNKPNTRLYFKILSDNEYVIGMFNFGEDSTKMHLCFKDMGIPYESGMALRLHNVLTGEDIGVMKDFHMQQIDGRSCIILKGKLVEA